MRLQRTILPQLDDNEVKALLECSFYIECKSIILTSQQPGSEKTITGTGHISQSNGRFKINCSVTTANGLPDLDNLLSNEQSGQLYSDDQYFQLQAIDILERLWTAQNVLVDSVPVVGMNRIRARADMLTHSYESKVPVQTHLTTLLYRGNIHLPYNRRTDIKTSIDGEILNRQILLNAAKFQAAGTDILIRQFDGFLRVDMHNITSDPTVFDHHLNHGLQFALSTPVDWCIRVNQEGRNSNIDVSASPTDNRQGHVPPPVGNSLGDLGFWNVIDRYVTHLINADKEKADALIYAVGSVLATSHAPTTTLAMALGPAVEGLIFGSFPQFAKAKDISDEDCCNAQQIIESSTINSALKNRLIGALERMTDASANSVLRHLVDDGIIDNKHMESWKRIRNPISHGAQIDLTQEFVDNLNKTLVLFNRIVLHEIGYQGTYVDYGQLGWPTLSYKVGSSDATEDANTASAQ